MKSKLLTNFKLLIIFLILLGIYSNTANFLIAQEINNGSDYEDIRGIIPKTVYPNDIGIVFELDPDDLPNLNRNNLFLVYMDGNNLENAQDYAFRLKRDALQIVTTKNGSLQTNERLVDILQKSTHSESNLNFRISNSQSGQFQVMMTGNTSSNPYILIFNINYEDTDSVELIDVLKVEDSNRIGAGCKNDADCKEPKPYCSIPLCMACLNDGHCPADSPKCYIIASVHAICVECVANEDCDGKSGTPYCDTISHKCKECGSDSDCPENKRCKTLVNKCKDCIEHGDCTDSTPFCSKLFDKCVECSEDKDCGSDEACSISGKCERKSTKSKKLATSN